MAKENILSGTPPAKYVEKADQVDWNAFKKLVHSRRSVRVFDPEPIPDAVVRDCLNLALLAPNSSNLQPWEFYWVKDSEKKKQMDKACLGQNAAKTASALIVCVARTNTWKRNTREYLAEITKESALPAVLDYYQKIVPFIYTVGWFSILGFFKRIAIWFMGFSRPMPRGMFSRSGLAVWAIKSTALACENLMLAFRAAGFDSCPMEGFDEVRVKKILQLPRDAEVVMVIGAGKRSLYGVYGARARLPEKNFIFEV